MAERMSWEEAVRWYRAQSDTQKGVLENYFDLPVSEAAHRFASGEEFAEVLKILGDGNGRSVLDLGAGNGIASFALAKAGYNVTALEPDPSLEVGAGSIRELAKSENLTINVIETWGETLPFDDESFDVVYARQVLHHARDLEQMLKETFRVLKHGGKLLATREHVINNHKQLQEFKDGHPLHNLYGGENAFTLKEYTSAIQASGLDLQTVWGPFDSIMNFFPHTEADRQKFLLKAQKARRLLYGYLLDYRRSRYAGRLYSFLAVKP